MVSDCQVCAKEVPCRHGFTETQFDCGTPWLLFLDLAGCLTGPPIIKSRCFHVCNFVRRHAKREIELPPGIKVTNDSPDAVSTAC